MLVSLKEILSHAEERGIAVGAFNTPNFECLRAVLDAAEKYKVPVILSHAQIHEYAAALEVIGPVMVFAAERSTVPVCVHLDHCESFDYMETALRLGFTGVMYDGSALPYEENVQNTIRAVELAGKYGVQVEAELGQLPSREGGEAAGPVYTDPELAVHFLRETNAEALAPSFGTAHGIYKAKPVLDLERVAEIKRRTGRPLVMHGGSGVSPEDYRRAIASGIRKINYYSYMSKAGTAAAKEFLSAGDVTYYHDVALSVQKAMQADAEKAIRVFADIE